MPARLVCALALLAALPVAALDLRGPELGAASNFGQLWAPAMFKAAQALGLRNFRDAHGDPGAFQFEARVYGREGQPCTTCGVADGVVRRIVQGQTTDVVIGVGAGESAATIDGTVSRPMVRTTASYAR